MAQLKNQPKTKREQDIADAEDVIEHLEMELASAYSMGNEKRVAQVEKWLAEAEDILGQLLAEA